MADNPFETIESAQQYMRLLVAEVQEVRAGIRDDVTEAERDAATRRLDALHIVEYKLKQLEQHLATAGRILNDLRMLRRLLVGDVRDLPAPDDGVEGASLPRH